MFFYFDYIDYFAYGFTMVYSLLTPTTCQGNGKLQLNKGKIVPCALSYMVERSYARSMYLFGEVLVMGWCHPLEVGLCWEV
jgi:hypothetical protein